MIDRNTAGAVIDRALSKGADFCEIFLEDKQETSIGLTSGIVTDISGVHLHGAGLYLLRGVSSVYVYSSDTSENGLLQLADRGAALLGKGDPGKAQNFAEKPVAEPNPVQYYPGDVAMERKIAALSETEKAVKAAGHPSLHAEYAYFDTDQSVLIASSDGTWAEDRRVTTRIRGRFNVCIDGQTNGDWADYARPEGIECLESGVHIRKFMETVKELAEAITAEESPKGKFPVVFEGEGCVGTFFHEACGHQLETTNMQSPAAYFRDKIGKKVAADCVTLIDDGTMPGMYGSSKYDDEGMPRQKNVLIENGILKSFLVDRLGARQLGVPRNGSGRRQNYTFAPAARMSNTYLAGGSDDPDGMIKDIDFGILAVKIGGGTGGEEFTLNLPKAYLIKNGKVDRLLKNAMLVGRGDETMLKIDRVAGNVIMEESGAFCGAASGLCNTTTSGPRMRVTEMVIG